MAPPAEHPELDESTVDVDQSTVDESIVDDDKSIVDDGESTVDDERENVDATTRSAPTVTPERAGAGRLVIFGCAALALLLVGAAVGMLLGLPRAATGGVSVPDANSVDVHFAQDMAMHHEQAVTMASYEWANTTDPQLKQLAFDMFTDQQEQIGRMKGWLSLWGQPEQPQAGPVDMSWMSSDGMSGMSAMPGMSGMSGAAGASAMAHPSNGAPMLGMANQQEMAKLQSLHGKQLDVYFLQLMLRHHEGGAPMAQYAAAHASVEQVRQLANSMLTSQGAEMQQMKSLLTSFGAQPLPLN